jgi:hypothetical protein
MLDHGGAEVHIRIEKFGPQHKKGGSICKGEDRACD